MGQFPAWLTKQMVSDIRGFNLDAYLVALEGWRRGLALKWYGDPSVVTDLKIIGFSPLGKTFSLSDDNMTHFFYRSRDRKSTRLNSSHVAISYAVFCLKKKKMNQI